MTARAPLAVLALLAVAAAPLATETRRVDLAQLTVVVPAGTAPERARIAIERFDRDTRALRSCADALRLMRLYKGHPVFKGMSGTLNTRSNVSLGMVPAPLRAQLLDRPVGHATSVFKDRNEYRVLVACSAPVVPPQAVERSTT